MHVQRGENYDAKKDIHGTGRRGLPLKEENELWL
jgi:hypothetical protein